MSISRIALARMLLCWLALGALSGCNHGHAVGTIASSSPSAVTSSAMAMPGSVPAGTEGPASLLGEVRRELAAMRTTRYQHKTEVDEASGTFFYDCSGLLDYALRRALPTAASALPTSTSARPLAGDIERYLHGGLTGPIDGWQTVGRVNALQSGDVVAWLATEDSTTGDTGHVMIALAAPVANPARAGEWLLPVADSTLSPHASDSRHPGDTGLGTGTIGLVADSRGVPTAFYWQGGVSKHPKPTEIALGRPQ